MSNSDEVVQDPNDGFKLVDAGEYKFGALNLALNNIGGFLQYARNKADEGTDFVKVDVPGVGRCVFTSSPEAAKVIFESYSKTRPAKFAKLVTQVFGGDGILTTTYAEERRDHPLTKLAGAVGVKNKFSQAEMRKPEFTKTINERSSHLVDKLSDSENSEYMDAIIHEMRLDYLASLYLSFDSDKEIQEFHNIWEYTEAVFGNVFMLTVMDMMPFVNQDNLLNIPGITQHIGRMKEKSDSTLLREVNRRFSLSTDVLEGMDNTAMNLPYDLLSQMIVTTRKELIERGTPFDSLDIVEQDKIKKDLVSNFYQVFFASLETSKAGILSTHINLSNDQNRSKFLELQKVVDTFVEQKGECLVSFQDLLGENPILGPIIEYAMTTVVNNVITPITNREINGTFSFLNGNGEIETFEDGDLVFMDVEQISKVQLQRMIKEGKPLNNVKTATDLLIFGDGLSKCKGAHWAIYEIVTQLVHTLHKARSLTVESSKYRMQTTNTYYDVDARIEKRVA
jgi:hypothetical protein